ncbi:MAG TPA: hypothetical protein VK971_07465 [Thiohalobacter sp.]|nr:hypothetical protein [Thiohalobacter sp.]
MDPRSLQRILYVQGEPDNREIPVAFMTARVQAHGPLADQLRSLWVEA